MKIGQILESATAGATSTGSVATTPKKSGKMIRRQNKPTDNALDSGKLFGEAAPKGWEGTVKAMKKHKEIDNPWALAHYMKNKGYKSHKNESVEDRTSYQVAKILAEKGIKYDSSKENQLISAIGMVMVKELGMEPRIVRNIIDRDDDFLADTLSELHHMTKDMEEGLNEFAIGSDDEEDPTDNYPCYDCGSTIFLHHTKLCELAEDNAIRDLPSKPGSQHWTGEVPKGLHPIPGLEEGFNGEYDDEAGMADNNLETMKRAVNGIDELISTGDNLPEWCQEKIAVAKSMLVTVWDYMASEEERGSEVNEHKKGVRAMKYTTKPRNFVAKNAAATTSGAGAHKDKKKAAKQGEVKHKNKEMTYESKLFSALSKRLKK